MAAWLAASMLAVIACLQVYWGLGGTLGLPAGEAASSTSEHVGSVLIGLLALAAAGVLLVRVGYWRGQVPVTAVWMARMLGFVALGGAVLQFAGRGIVSGTINLIVAVLAFVVARSDLPPSLRSGRLGPPSPTR